MTIQLYLEVNTSMRDLQTLKTIFDAGVPELVEPLSNFMQPLNISSTPFAKSLIVNVTIEEFALIGVFNNGIK